MSRSQDRLAALRMRVEHEFQDLPGLRLTRWQAARLWNLELAECDDLLQRLVAAKVLRHTHDGFVAGELCRPPRLTQQHLPPQHRAAPSRL